MSLASTPKCEHGNYIDAERGLSCVMCERVTDEMVDRALAAFFKPFYTDNAGDKVAMKIALEAALNK